MCWKGVESRSRCQALIWSWTESLGCTGYPMTACPSSRLFQEIPDTSANNAPASGAVAAPYIQQAVPGRHAPLTDSTATSTTSRPTNPLSLPPHYRTTFAVVPFGFRLKGRSWPDRHSRSPPPQHGPVPSVDPETSHPLAVADQHIGPSQPLDEWHPLT